MQKKKLAILTYLNENTNQPINISKIAEHLGLSYHGIAPLIEEMQQEFSALYQVSLCEKGFQGSFIRRTTFLFTLSEVFDSGKPCFPTSTYIDHEPGNDHQ